MMTLWQLRSGSAACRKREALVKASSEAEGADAKVAKLTAAVEVLIAHLSHQESEKRMAEMNRETGNF